MYIVWTVVYEVLEIVVHPHPSCVYIPVRTLHVHVLHVHVLHVHVLHVHVYEVIFLNLELNELHSQLEPLKICFHFGF
jgi:hypothetical protein